MGIVRGIGGREGGAGECDSDNDGGSEGRVECAAGTGGEVEGDFSESSYVSSPLCHEV
jgi:hypothetical protein